MLEEGWYLMSVPELERELARLRTPDVTEAPSAIRRLTVEEALTYRDDGNLPDPDGRSLRLVLRVGDESLSQKRLRYEPDYHEEPTWRRQGSRPVNVVPIHPAGVIPAATDQPWWEQPDVAELEDEWRVSGRVDGVAIPEGYRSFVLKTIAALNSAGIAVTIDAIAGSLARWLSPGQVDEIRRALVDANR